MKIETILVPAELPALAKRDLRGSVCVVFDVLRATSTFVTALQNGAKEIIPVSEISEALEIKKNRPAVLLGGERDGVKIHAKGVIFDFGNSPREYAPEKVQYKTIVSTTTNGTRALRACAGAKGVLAASLLNLSATANFLREKKIESVLLVCAGTRESAALEDILAAGALCELLAREDARAAFSDATQIALAAFAQTKSDLAAAICQSENALRLLAIPELREDVDFCLRRNVFNLVAALNNGAIRVLI